MTGETSLLMELNQAISFQNKWRGITSVLHNGFSVLAIVSSSIATVAAGFSFSKEAAVFAALATVLLSSERILKLREKWIHHLQTGSKLDALRLNLRFGAKDDASVAEEMGQILQGYASALPTGDSTNFADTKG